jgi:pSer/pThr/pTyr-binding forkhead associated (FHA) protein
LVLPDGVRYPLGGETSIGRAENCDIIPEDQRINARHAYVGFHDGQYYVQDLGSAYGVQANGQSVSTQWLRHGDVISIADWHSDFRFR